jgi:hypothetical protein
MGDQEPRQSARLAGAPPRYYYEDLGRRAPAELPPRRVAIQQPGQLPRVEPLYPQARPAAAPFEPAQDLEVVVGQPDAALIAAVNGQLPPVVATRIPGQNRQSFDVPLSIPFLGTDEPVAGPLGLQETLSPVVPQITAALQQVFETLGVALADVQIRRIVVRYRLQQQDYFVTVYGLDELLEALAEHVWEQERVLRELQPAASDGQRYDDLVVPGQGEIVSARVEYALAFPDPNAMQVDAPPVQPVVPVEEPQGGCVDKRTIPADVCFSRMIINHDDPRVYHSFVDDNCGIRAYLYASQTDPSRSRAEVFRKASWMRFEALVCSPYKKLTPLELLQILMGEIDYRATHVIAIPDSKHDVTARTYHSDDVRPMDEADVYLALWKGHYYNVLGGLHTFQKLARLLYCKRCHRYIFAWAKRATTTHVGETMFVVPADRYRTRPPPTRECNSRGHQEPIKSHASLFKADVRDRHLKYCKTDHPHTVTPLNHVGFADFETWHRHSASHQHKVYAVGWLPALKETPPKPEEVRVYFDADAREECLYDFLKALITFVKTNAAYTPKTPYYLYLYNGSAFDNLFIMNYLALVFHMVPDHMTQKENKVLSLNYCGDTLLIRDLCLFTLSSLRLACETYKVPDKYRKGEFDHELITSRETLLEHWDEIHEYLRLDVVSLAYVFIRVRNDILQLFSLDVCKRLTISQLAYDHWTSNLHGLEAYQKMIPIPRDWQEYTHCLKAYSGGRVFGQVKHWTSRDVGKLYDDIRDYGLDMDVVSLYPTAMWTSVILSKALNVETNVPKYFCGTPTFFEHHPALLDLMQTAWPNAVEQWRRMPDACWPQDTVPILHKPTCALLQHVWTRYMPDAYDVAGYMVCVDVACPKELMIPLLPHKTDKGATAWDLKRKHRQWYVLDELLDAVRYGYRVERLHCGYDYPKRMDCFGTTIEPLAAKKAACADGDPARDVIKLTMNSIYGKHGQKPITHTVKLIMPEQKIAFEKEHDQRILSTLPLVNAQRQPVMLVYTVQEENTLPTKPTAFAAQVTAYSRMIMNYFMMRHGLLFDSENLHQQLFYQDTDSMVMHVDACRDHMAGPMYGKGLGQLADELKGGKIIRFVCLAPKTYCLVYVMPDQKVKMKIRAKGLPHTRQTLDAKPYPAPPDAEPLLGKPLYDVTYDDGRQRTFLHLDYDIYMGLLEGSVASLNVRYVTMKKSFYEANTAQVATIHHMNQTRGLRGAPWWQSHRVDLEGGLTRPLHDDDV